MVKTLEKSTIKKIKFYDSVLWIGLASLLFIIFDFFSKINSVFLGWMFIIAILFLVICMGIINWGMVYHEIKRRDWGWLISTIIIVFVGGAGLIISIIYYFAIMRKEFKKGEGIYTGEEASIFSDEIWKEKPVRKNKI